MSNASGPAAALSSTEPDASGLDWAGSKKALPNSDPASLSADPWVKALFDFSQAVAAKTRLVQRKAHGVSGADTGSEGLSVPQSCRSQFAEPAVSETTASLYSLADLAPQLANPLAPLRDRDRQALTDMFDHQHMVAIEADILTRLSYLVPEPPWDIEPYEFLREFL